MRIPLSTYRFQFTPSFRFEDVEKIVPYLKDLGISDIYASPILESKTGSQYGYDLIDFREINHQLGGEKAFYRLVRQIKKGGIGWLQDIVPNHMAYHSSNPFLYDVLEKGKKSIYGGYFDINWQTKDPLLKGKLLFPFLEKPLKDCLQEKLIQLLYEKGKFYIGYHDFRLPLSYQNIGEILSLFQKQIPDQGQQSIPEREPENENIQWLLAQVNKNPSHPDTIPFWQELLSRQYYLLSHWKEARENINYRRFFSINELICLKAEGKPVFDAIHQRILAEINKGNISGLRIDHLDGLFDPRQYLERLKRGLANTYLVVEKILQPGEMLPSDFLTEGNTGYDFLYYLNNLFCQKRNKIPFLRIYHSFTGQKLNIANLLLKKKRIILKQQMYGDLKNLAQLFYDYYKQHHLKSRLHPFISYEKLILSLQEIMIRMPVYRTYLSPSHLNKKDINRITEIMTQTRQAHPELTNDIDYLLSAIIHPLANKKLSEKDKNELLQLIMRWQQFTGPLMAKGMEDTLLYCYHPLVSLNEVGGEPATFGVTKNEFYRFVKKRLQKWPYSMNTSMTHDTKRGEDVRARINVLSEIPKQWQKKLYYWHQLNLTKKKKVYSLLFPDKNMEYFIYQTLIGTIPFSGLSGVSRVYTQRIQEYLIKSAREAKIYTSWQNPYVPYEEALTNFTDEILNQVDQKSNPFLNDLFAFHKLVSHYGLLNSLSQVLLKLTCPGVPDFYQGSELWDLRLVDPDNRAPVDYTCRIHLLEDIQSKQKQDHIALLKELLEKPADGRVKLFLTHQLLKLRNKEPEVFQKGSFVPLSVQGRYKNHTIAYLRTYQNKSILIVVPRFCTTMVKPGQYPLGIDIWQDTYIKLPISIKLTALEWICHQSIQLGNLIPVGKILKNFPVAVILIKKES